jgi:cytochrome c-type biogenesis protein CcmH
MPAEARPLRAPRRWWVGPLVLVVVLVVALSVGSGALSGGPASATQRAAALETQLRCPSCIDVSVADSSAATAASLRHQILDWVRAGQSDQQIENQLIARYGPSILLTPPGGASVVIWAVPAAAGAAALAGLAVLFWRRSRSWRGLRAVQAVDGVPSGGGG